MRDSLESVLSSVKSRLDICEVVGRYVELNRQNKALCPFHDENTPSFSVNAKGQYFHCFGCGKSGDVIAFLMLREGKPFMQVLREQAASLGIPFPDSDPAWQQAYESENRRREVLGAAVAYYHNHNRLTDQARTYLHERGLTDETITRFRIGYAGGGLRDYLLDKQGFKLEECVSAGVLRKSENGRSADFFVNRIVFPNLRHGQVVHMTARSLGDNRPKYLHLPGKMTHLFNEDALLEPTVLLAEGPIDCLTAVQAGIPAAAVLGTGQFSQEHVERFRQCSTVYICMDGDDAGRGAAARIAELLADKACIVDMPDGLDINEFVRTHSPDDFRKLVDAARPYLDLEYERIKKAPENLRTSEIERFLPRLAGLSAFRQSQYGDRIKKDFGLSKATIKQGIAARTNTAAADAVSGEPEARVVTEAEKDAAMDLLTSPDLLERLSEVLTDLGCVGEEDNRIIIYLALTSRLSDTPINLIVKGDASGGKSYLVDKVSTLFPPEQVLIFTALTPKALYHRTDSLAHKALIIIERHGAEESDYSIRSLQSEKKLIISTSVKDPETQQWRTEDHTVDGPVACIETTTQMHLHDENETRCFEIFIDDSEEQTKRIQDVQRKMYQLPIDCRRPDTSVWQMAQRLLRSFPVIIPFSGRITFPTKPLRVRRDFTRFLTLIEASARLHQYQREIRTVDGQDYIVATLEDYAVAYLLARTALQSTVMRISPKAESLARAIHDSAAKSQDEPLTRRQIRELVKWDMKTTKKYLDELVDQGVLELKATGRGNPHEYTFVRLPDRDDNLLIDPDRMRKLIDGGDRSNLSRVRENGIGEVNILSDNHITEVVKPIQGR